MKTILVPVDFSENADKTIVAAKKVARVTGAKLLIMYAYQPYVADYAVPESIVTAPIYLDLEADYRQKLHDCVSRAQQEGYRADPIWETGSVETAVLRQAKDTSADLLVVGRTGHGTFIDRLIGSSATGIALHAPCPVLIVPPGTRGLNFERVVYASQLEFDERQTLLDVIGLVKQLNGKLRLVKVNSDEQLNIQPDKQFIDEIENETGINRDDIILLNGQNVMHTLEDYCDKVQADLLIVSNKKRGLFGELLNPSLTKKLTIDTQVPILVYHQKSSENAPKVPMVILA